MSLSLPMRYDDPPAGWRALGRRRTLLFASLVCALMVMVGYSAHSLGVLPLSRLGFEQIYEQTAASPSDKGIGHASRPLSVRAARKLQDKLYAKTSMHLRPVCEWTSWHEERYAPLRGTNRRVMIPILLHNNGQLISTLAQELPVVVEWLGVDNVFFSVYESGSGDQTHEYLGDLAKIFDSIGAHSQIVTYGDARHENTKENRRIIVIAAARNAALRPFYTGQVATALGGEPDEVFYLNDVFFCAPDLLEILLQYRQQGMHQACATDWDDGVYDRWVLRAISGKAWWRQEEIFEYFGSPNDHPKTRPVPLQDEEVDRRRWERHLPLQVFSCWNGATVIDAKAFLPPHNMRFRQSGADWENKEKGIPLNATAIASECFLSSVDLWKMGFNRIAIIPKASVTYWAQKYDEYRKDSESFAPKGDDEAFEWINNWKTTPPEKVISQDYTRWDIPERLVPWDEL